MMLDGKALATPITFVGRIGRRGDIKEPGEFSDDTRTVHDCSHTAGTPLVSQAFFQFAMIEISYIGAVETLSGD